MTQVIKERNIYHIRYYFRKTKHYSLLLFLPSNFHELYCLKQHNFSQFPWSSFWAPISWVFCSESHQDEMSILHSRGSLGTRTSVGSPALELLLLSPHLYSVTSKEAYLQQLLNLTWTLQSTMNSKSQEFLRIQELGFIIFWFQASTR